MTSPIRIFSIPGDPEGVMPYFRCTICGHQETWPTRDDAGCASSWHVYENHREVWESMFGDRPPTDRDPRTQSASGEVHATTHSLAERTDQARDEWAARAKAEGEDVHFATHYATLGPESPQVGETIPWALCDRADQVQPDPGKFVATGSLTRLVSCTRCLAIMAKQQILYAVVLGVVEGDVTGVLCYVVEHGGEPRLMELWGHVSSSFGWLKQDLTVNFGRVSQLDEMFPQGYRVVHVDADDPVPEEIQQWFGEVSIDKLRKDLLEADQEAPPPQAVMPEKEDE